MIYGLLWLNDNLLFNIYQTFTEISARIRRYGKGYPDLTGRAESLREVDPNSEAKYPKGKCAYYISIWFYLHQRWALGQYKIAQATTQLSRPSSLWCLYGQHWGFLLFHGYLYNVLKGILRKKINVLRFSQAQRSWPWVSAKKESGFLNESLRTWCFENQVRTV